jgi:hypothetical protein
MKMKRIVVVGLCFFAAGALSVLAYQHRQDLILLPLALILAFTNGTFWVFYLISLTAFLLVSWRRRQAYWKKALVSISLILPAAVGAGLWWLLFVEGPLFNLFAPLTDEFKVYRAECQGWVFRPGESIGGAGICYGFYKFLGGSSTYKVDVPHRKVWIWHEEPIEASGRWGTNGGWVALTQANPDVRKNCEVRDYSNWACTDSDQYGTSITQLVGGREHHYEYGKPNPSDAFLNAFASLARCDVQVDALTFWRLWAGPFGILGYRTVEAMPERYSFHLPGSPDRIDCTNPPP